MYKGKPRPELIQPTDPSYRLISLTQGQVAIVDTQDYERLAAFKWCATKRSKEPSPYAMRSDVSGGKKKSIYMAREIMGFPSNGLLVDHINHDTLDNRRDNLRIATPEQNRHNSRGQQLSSTKYKGVFEVKYKIINRFKSSIVVNGVRKFLGYFPTPELASEAYETEAKNMQGDFCYRKELDHANHRP